MKREIDSPEALSRLVSELREELQAAGFHEAAERFSDIENQVYTTGNEWLCELQSAAIYVKKHHRVPADIKTKLKLILAPTYEQRLVQHQIWQAAQVGLIILVLGISALALCYSFFF